MVNEDHSFGVADSFLVAALSFEQCCVSVFQYCDLLFQFCSVSVCCSVSVVSHSHAGQLEGELDLIAP